MRGKRAKELRRVAAATGVDYQQLKAAYKRLKQGRVSARRTLSRIRG